MDINQLKYFLEIVKHNHFTIAADELCMSQSSLSKHIKSLEEELGIKLLDRGKRNIGLTPFGKEFVEFSKKVLLEYNDINSKAKKYKALENGELRIGAVSNMNQYGITSLIASFQKCFSNIQIEIKQRKTKELINLFKLGEIDVAFFTSDSIIDASFDTYPVIQDELVLITDYGSKFANSDKISLSEISSENFIYFESTSGMYDIFTEACNKEGFVPNIVHKCAQADTIIELVAEGIGVSLLTNKVVNYFNNPNIKIIHFKNPIIVTTYIAVSHGKKLSESVASFLKFSLKWIDEKNGK
jgi:LysR family transcriptional activator of glutamate synthase operon